MHPYKRIFVALDTVDLGRAARLVAATRDLVGGYKVGKEFFTAHGPQGMRQVVGTAPLFSGSQVPRYTQHRGRRHPRGQRA